MVTLETGNRHVSIRLTLGHDFDPQPSRGIRIASIRDVVTGHEYLAGPTALFEFAVDNGPARSSSPDVVVTGHGAIAGRITVDARATSEPLSFRLEAFPDASHPVVEIRLTVTNHGGHPVFFRSVIPKIRGLVARGQRDAHGMVSMEIGSVLPLLPLAIENATIDERDGSFHAGTMGMPYREKTGRPRRIGLPVPMNTMELVSFHDPDGGGGFFVADIDHHLEGTLLEAARPPIQFTLSAQEVAGFWVAELPPSAPVRVSGLAIGVHHAGDWHEAVDYYVAKHRHRWTFPRPRPGSGTRPRSTRSRGAGRAGFI